MLNRLNLNRHFSLKITLPVILLLMIAVSVLVGVALYNQDAMLLSQEESRLKSLVNSFNSENDLHGKMALSLATSIANMPEVQNRFETGDRQGLLDYLKNLYQSLHTEFNVEQAQFHLAPATSFLRLNKPEKFGDDLSTFRFMVVAANKEHKAFYGLEFGYKKIPTAPSRVFEVSGGRRNRRGRVLREGLKTPTSIQPRRSPKTAARGIENWRSEARAW